VDELRPHLAGSKRGVLVVKTNAFWQHEGGDLDQCCRQRSSGLAGAGYARGGGSTITQQLAKNCTAP